METYWELYVAYVDYCVKNNKKHSIDPHHYEMEWNHFLPKCVFGDWPIGQWLTKRQHAIATALQTLALNKCCLYGKHLTYLPKPLLDLVYPVYRERSVSNGKKAGSQRGPVLGKENVELKRGFLDPANKEKVLEGNRKGGIKVGSKYGPENVTKNKGPWNPENKDKLSDWGRKGGSKSSKQKWMSTVDGYINNAGTVARHNIRLGADPSARVKIDL
jgi:hypothetical protein